MTLGICYERAPRFGGGVYHPILRRLESFSDESLRSTIVFGRVPDHEGTIMRRLGDLPHFNEVVERTGIEEMFTTGWLEMAL